MKGRCILGCGSSADKVSSLGGLLCCSLALIFLTGCTDEGVVLEKSNIASVEQPTTPEPTTPEPTTPEPTTPEPTTPEPTTPEPTTPEPTTPEPTPTLSLVELGERIFDDASLSSPVGQSCSGCHSESTKFVDPDFDHASSLGANGGDFGLRNTPTLFYVDQIPDFQVVERPNVVTQVLQDVEFGGLFLDGRSATLEEQAKQPFFNPIEMALPSVQEFATRIQGSDYSQEFQALFGSGVFENPETTLNSAASALAAFQRSRKFSPFNSKFDRVKSGQEAFTDSEARGEALFNGRALCSSCHVSPDEPEVFSNFLYHNIGVPRNPALLNDIGDQAFVDLGLGATTGDSADNGKFRTPTLRNVEHTAPYMHNGVFTTLREVVEFYSFSTSTPEVQGNNIPPFIGFLFLSDVQIGDIVAFLKTLSD